ncbi:MAG: hypothetical protein U0X73_01605 [Thermoanaerobaculia bacterium]
MASVASRPRAPWIRRFVTRLVLWILPVAALWLALEPFYNKFLAASGERLLRMTESPAVTRLYVKDTHSVIVTRSDYAAEKGYLYGFRVGDVHFHLILLGALMLAVPDIPGRKRWENLGWSVLATIFFDILLVFFFVKFAYSTQLGQWSREHYGVFGRNFWGLGKHLLDLPFKFALPFLLWGAFYYGEFLAHLRPAKPV